MPTNVDIPTFGESITEAVLVKWLKADGQLVAANEPLCELETDKANVDLPSPGAGVLRRAAEEGQTVHVGETVGRIEDSPAAVASAKSPATTGAASSGPARSAVPSGTAATAPRPAGSGASQSSPAASQSSPAPSQTAPSQTAPSQTAPSQTAPSQTAPSQVAPSQAAPSQTVQPRAGQSQTAQSQAAQSPALQSQAAPSQAAPAQASPAPAAAAATTAPPRPAAGPASAVPTVPSDQSPSVRRLASESGIDPSTVAASGRGGRVTKQDMQQAIDRPPGGDGAAPNPTTPGPTTTAPAAPGSTFAPVEESDDAEPAPPARKPSAAPAQPVPAAPPARPLVEKLIFDSTGTKRVAMSKMRKKIAERLVAVQQQAAILTTFNEVDLTAILSIRSKYKQRFIDIHGISLGLMSFFCRAAVLGLAEFPRINASIDGDDIIYHQHVHLGIAVSTDRGLAVPVLRNAETLSFAKIESEVKRLAAATRDGKLSMEELGGGTFTITNGGVFGSLLSTPILNPPQSGILGMHAIQKRPMVVDGKIEARDMMYVALSYDHRLVDGRESVSFLVRLKEMLEDPTRLILEI